LYQSKTELFRLPEGETETGGQQSLGNYSLLMDENDVQAENDAKVEIGKGDDDDNFERNV